MAKRSKITPRQEGLDIRKALGAARGDVGKAAKALKMSPAALRARCKKYKIKPEKFIFGGKSRGKMGLAVEKLEATTIKTALQASGGVAEVAIERTGLVRSTFFRRVRQYGIDLKVYRGKKPKKVGGKIDLPGAVAKLEKQMLLAALKRHKGDVRAASSQVGIPRATFYRKMSRYGIKQGKHRKG